MDIQVKNKNIERAQTRKQHKAAERYDSEEEERRRRRRKKKVKRTVPKPRTEAYLFPARNSNV